MLVSCFQTLAVEAKAKKKVYARLFEIEGLSQWEGIRVGGLIVSCTSKISYFFPLLNECKKEYLDGELIVSCTSKIDTS